MNIGGVSGRWGHVFREDRLAEINPVIVIKQFRSHLLTFSIWLLKESKLVAVLVCPLSTVAIDIMGSVLKSISIVVIDKYVILFGMDSKVSEEFPLECGCNNF